MEGIYTYFDSELSTLLAKLEKQGKNTKEIQRYKPCRYSRPAWAMTSPDAATSSFSRATTLDAELIDA